CRSRALSFNKHRLDGAVARCTSRIVQLVEQAPHRKLSERNKILSDCRKRWMEIPRFRNVIKSGDRTLCRYLEPGFFEGAERTQGHLIVGANQCREWLAVCRQQFTHCLKSPSCGPIGFDDRSGLEV